jgi:hypothetical protein
MWKNNFIFAPLKCKTLFMTIEEILRLENANATSIHFILEGTFWHVYERSAFLTCKYLKELKITRKYVKSVGRDVAYGGFPKESLPALVAKGKSIGALVSELGQKCCSLLSLPETEGFESWRNTWALKEKSDYKLSDNLPVYKTIYDLLFSLFGLVRHFPKDFQYTLGERIKNSIIELTEKVYYANTCETPEEKLGYLKELCVKTETIRLLLRICYDLRLYNLDAYICENEKIEAISKQLHGWRKQVQAGAPEGGKKSVPAAPLATALSSPAESPVLPAPAAAKPPTPPSLTLF